MTAVFRGTRDAAALVIDPVLVGETEARRRVLAIGDRAGDLRMLPDGRWLVVLARPAEVRSELADGLVLVGDSGGLTVPGLVGTPGTITWQHRSAIHRATLADLPALRTAGWIDVSGFAVHRLMPLDRPEPQARQPVEPLRPEPDLRAAARLGPPDRRRIARLTRRRPGDLAAAALDRLARALVPLAVVLIVLVVAGVVSYGVGRAGGNGAVAYAVVAVVAVRLLIRSIRRRAARSLARTQNSGSVAEAGPGRFRRWLTRLLAEPVKGALQRRHERYLRDLTAKFERRDWDNALRDAIRVNGDTAADWTRLAMPKRRDDLRMTMRRGSGGGVDLGATAHSYLRAMYRQAAEQLESSGDIELATFVHGELLEDVPAAVALLERQGRLRLAAELAEARALAPELVVRLWWRAGDHERAVLVARARNSFAAAITRLQDLDAAAAADLRAAWVAHLQQAGDHLGAVNAAWPQASLRSDVIPDIKAGMALGGSVAGRLFAHLVTEWPSEAAVARALALLRSGEPELHRARESLVESLAAMACTDPVADRELSTAAVRAAYDLEPTVQRRTHIRELGVRADPLLRADLAPIAVAPAAAFEGADLAATQAVGQLPVWDAVTLGGRTILVAHGDHGVRLLGLDGRTRARWDLPAHELVVADGGRSALLVRNTVGTREIHHLDLLTRRTQPWATLHRFDVVPSFDGGTAVTVDANGIAFVDVLTDPPRVLWRELDDRHRVLHLARTPTRLTALLLVPSDAIAGTAHRTELWTWELPSVTLRQRRVLDIESMGGPTTAVVCDGAAIFLGDGDGGDPKLTYVRGHRDDLVVPAAPGTTLATSGAALLVQRPLADGRMCTVDVGLRPGALYATFPAGAGQVRLREHGGIVTLWDDAGRIVAGDPGGAGTLAAFSTSF